MLRKIVLHGRLGLVFGRSFMLDVSSPAEALRALTLQIKGFRDHLREGHYRVVRGSLRAGRDLDLDECKIGLGKAQSLHIVPVVAGSSSGLGKILAGVALVALAVFAPVGALAIGSFSLVPTIGAIGVSLALGGVSQLLAPSPKLTGGSADADRKDSFLFGGQENVITQGGPVPLVYGQFEVGSVVVSEGLDVEQILTGDQPTVTASVVLTAFFTSKGH